MKSKLLVWVSCLSVVFGFGCVQGKSGKQDESPLREYLSSVDSALFHSLEWRPIGPPRGGQAPAVIGDPRDPLVFYFGAAAGGVWKTDDGGTYWRNVSDGFFTSASVNALAIAESDPNVIYAGTGKTCPHPNIEPGDGVYKSTDAGKTWVHVGLKETQHIGAIVVHPKNPNLVYVAAMGHHFGTNPERGVFRSKDGGKTWQRVLFKSERAGAVDLAMDPSNPDVIYAAIWQFLRQPWSEESGGPDSGLYKTTDGGETWKDISNTPGLPKGVKGRIGVSISASRPSRIYAIIEADEGGLYRSDDSGATWQLMSDKREFRYLASWFTHVVADPTRPDTVYLPWMELFKSTDGGRTLAAMSMPHSDHHDLWIDPKNPQRMIDGSDGGAIVSLNGGRSWSTQYNQPTSQFYHLAVDNQFPYSVYATQMDNAAISCPSRTHEGLIGWKDCDTVGTAESGSIVVRPDDPNVIIAGSIGSSSGGGGNMIRYDRRTHQQRLITVWPEDQYQSPVKDVKYRFYFTYPIVLSPHDPNVVYACANKVFRTTNEGSSWEAISPDLTKQDASKMQELDGGPITGQEFSSMYSSVIYAFAESRIRKGELWAGTDDGSIHLSRDGGRNWANVSPKALLPEWTIISTIEVSPHDVGTAYVAAHRYKLDDTRPFLLRTIDYGKTWQQITKGIREGDFCRVIREDTVRPGLLFAGTWSGVYVSFDAGGNWQSLQLNLPVVPVHDLIVKNNDLVAGTFGRSIWILDDLTALREVNGQMIQAKAHLFHVPPAYRLLGGGRGSGRGANADPQYLRIGSDSIAIEEVRRPDGRTIRNVLNGGQSPTPGIWVSYYLKEKPEGEVSLTFLDGRNQVIRTYGSGAMGERGPRVSTRQGANRFTWDMTYPNARELAPGIYTGVEWARTVPATAPPGSYKVQLRVGGQLYEQPFEIRKDPRIKASQPDLEAQFALTIRIRDRISEVTDAVNELRKARSEVERAEKSAAGRADVQGTAVRVKVRLHAIEGALTRLPGPSPMRSPPKALNLRLAALTSVVQSADEAPTRQTYEVFDSLSERVATQLTQLKEVLRRDVPDFLKMADRH
jgi:photosystem II stability/assembly factor-like uncharacterized protein